MSARRRPSPAALRRAKQRLTRDHPQLRGLRPRVAARADGNFTLTYRDEVVLPDGATLKQVTRATIDGAGRIVRVAVGRGGRRSRRRVSTTR